MTSTVCESASDILEAELSRSEHSKLRPKVYRVIGKQLTHLRNFGDICSDDSRTYAFLLWRSSLKKVISDAPWPKKIRTLAENVTTAHFRRAMKECANIPKRL